MDEVDDLFVAGLPPVRKKSGRPRKWVKPELLVGEPEDEEADEVVPTRFRERYESLALVAKTLDPDELKETIKRHLVLLLGRVGSVREYLAVMSEISDLMAWRKSAEIKAAKEKPAEDVEEDAKVALLRKRLEEAQGKGEET